VAEVFLLIGRHAALLEAVRQQFQISHQVVERVAQIVRRHPDHLRFDAFELAHLAEKPCLANGNRGLRRERLGFEDFARCEPSVVPSFVEYGQTDQLLLGDQGYHNCPADIGLAQVRPVPVRRVEICQPHD